MTHSVAIHPRNSYFPTLRSLGLLLLLACSALLAACGGSGSSSGSSPATLTSISVAPPNNTLAKGLSLQLSSTGVYSDGTHKDISSQVTWSSGDASIAAVTSTGMASALSAGATTLTATLGSISGSAPITVTAAALVSINVTPESTSLPQGLTSAFTATGVYTDSSTQNLTAVVTWASSSATVASVSNTSGSNGRVSALAQGSTTISAAYSGIGGSTPLTVTAVALVSIGVTPGSSSLPLTIMQAYRATGTYSDNTTGDVTASATWSSSDTTIASVSNTAGSIGQVTGVAVGSASITATVGGVAGSAPLTVSNATLTAIDVTPANGSIAKGLSRQLTATGTFSDSTTFDLSTQLNWSSADNNTVGVSNASGFQGLVTAVNVGGPISITATLGSVSGATAVTVTPATLSTIGVTPTSPSAAAGNHQQLAATATYSDNSHQDVTASVTWASSNTSVATISNASGTQGYATALSIGTTSITAALAGVVSPADTLTVTPAVLTSIAVAPATATVAKGLTQQFTATGTYSDNTTRDVTQSVAWASATPTVASISNASGSAGLAQSLDIGSTAITASSGSIVSVSASLTVSAATLSSIAVTPAAPSIANGTSQQFTATGTFSDASTQDLSGSATWSSSNMAVAVVSNANGSKGLANTVGAGSATITATLGAKSGTSALTVTGATLVAIAIAPAPASVYVMGTTQFTATGTYSDATTQNITSLVAWSSSQVSNAAVSNASGSNGLATGVAVGTTSITAAAGSVTSPVSTLTVRAQGYAYVADEVANEVSAYKIESNGALTLIHHYALADGVGRKPFAVAVDPSNQHLYVTNYQDGTISQFNIASDGSLTSMAAPIVTVAPGNNGLVVDSSGHFVFTANFDDNSVSMLTADMTGQLTLRNTFPMASFGLAANASPAFVTVDPLTRYAYVSLYGVSQVAQFNIDTTSYSLTAMTAGTTVTSAGQPGPILTDAQGKYVYTSAFSTNVVSQYTISSVDGSLTPFSTRDIATATTPVGMALDPSGRYFYVGDQSNGGAVGVGVAAMSQYAVGANGVLAALAPASVSYGTPTSQSSGVAVDPTGNFVYVTDRGSNMISMFTVAADGTLAAPPVSILAEAGPTGIALTH